MPLSSFHYNLSELCKNLEVGDSCFLVKIFTLNILCAIMKHNKNHYRTEMICWRGGMPANTKEYTESQWNSSRPVGPYKGMFVSTLVRLFEEEGSDHLECWCWLVLRNHVSGPPHRQQVQVLKALHKPSHLASLVPHPPPLHHLQRGICQRRYSVQPEVSPFWLHCIQIFVFTCTCCQD